MSHVLGVQFYAITAFGLESGSVQRTEYVCCPDGQDVCETGNTICRFQGLYGSDGTRTRDLRRDRPVRRSRLRPATTRNYRLQQALPRFANRL
jgi:hypothetical protein